MKTLLALFTLNSFSRRMLLCLIAITITGVSRVHAQLQSSGDNRSFSVVAVGGKKTHYPMFVLEGSLGNYALAFGIGGGYMGWDRQTARYGSATYDKDMVKVLTSVSLVDAPNRLGPDTYMSGTFSRYYGVTARGGFRYYFDRQPYRDRLTGLYAGLDLSLSKIYEDQEITYQAKVGKQTWTIAGRNEFFALGTAVKVGYNWYPGKSECFHLNMAVARPFYIPFQEEINIFSPFTASTWEFEIGSD
jgi:hypothetical protein